MSDSGRVCRTCSYVRDLCSYITQTTLSAEVHKHKLHTCNLKTQAKWTHLSNKTANTNGKNLSVYKQVYGQQNHMSKTANSLSLWLGG